MGASSIMGSINIIATILHMRAPGMTLMKMPLFVWTWLITAYLLIAVMPVLAGCVTMMLWIYILALVSLVLLVERPSAFSAYFLVFGHPEVYIMILPAFGIASAIIPTFARKPLGYASMVYATASIAFLSFIVWAHHMFTVGMPIAGELFFMYATMPIAIPTGVKVFNWVTTMFRGSMTFETPMLFAIAFVILFTIGGFSGLMLAIAPLTSNITTHTLLLLISTMCWCLVIFSIFAAVYYYCGNMYDERQVAHFWLSFIGLNVTFFPMHFVGLLVCKKDSRLRTQFADFNQIASMGVSCLHSAKFSFCLLLSKQLEAARRQLMRFGES